MESAAVQVSQHMGPGLQGSVVMGDVINRLLKSEEPSVRYKVRVGVLGADPQSRPIRRLQGQTGILSQYNPLPRGAKKGTKLCICGAGRLHIQPQDGIILSLVFRAFY